MFFKNIYGSKPSVTKIRENPIDDAIPSDVSNEEAPDPTLLDDNPDNDPETETEDEGTDTTEDTTDDGGDDGGDEPDDTSFGGGDDDSNPELDKGDFRIEARDNLLTEDVNSLFDEVKSFYELLVVDDNVLDNKHFYKEVLDESGELLKIVKLYRMQYKRMGYLKAKDTLLKVKTNLLILQESVRIIKEDLESVE